MDEKLRDLKYHLISPRHPRRDQVELHNQVFELWMSIWQPTLNGLGYNDALLHDDFIRQDLISCITYQNQAIGVLLFSFFTLGPKAVMNFRYMKNNYNDIYFQKIKMMGVETAMSMQYLAIHSDWHGRKKPIAPISVLLAGLANKVRDHYGIDAGIAPTRRDFKVAEPYYAHGGDCILAQVPSHNVECDLIANIRGRTHDHPNDEIQKLEDHLWNTRSNSSQTEILPVHRETEIQFG